MLDRFAIKPARYYNTIKYLKIRQIAYQVFYRIKSRFISFAPYPVFIERTGTGINLLPAIRKSKSLVGTNIFRFLNIESAFDGNWNDLSKGKLWIYNLNYMDYLCQADIDLRTGLFWIRRFISDLPANKIGREQYPVSLRNINWIKFLAENRSNMPHDELAIIDGTLWASYLWLRRNPEYHLLGNHLLENGFSLLFGSFYFRDEILYKQAEKLVISQLDEQILNDGGHFELSPMYHQIILERLLDCINLVSCNENVFGGQDSLLRKMKVHAGKMFGWLKNILLDGCIPKFNDSVCGIAASAKELFEYGQSLNVDCVQCGLDDSGYRKFKGKKYELIADIGKIGPDYIPGHAHSDTFSFVMNVSELPFIVDTGVSTYNNDSRRQDERSTMSHNTVAVNRNNSSDVWGAFRVGRRARVKVFMDSVDELTAEHDGYKYLNATHRRSYRFTENNIMIEDHVTGDLPGISNLHFHPETKVQINGNHLVTDRCIIELHGFKTTKICKFQYCRGFNNRVESVKFQGTFYNKSSINIIVADK